MNLYVSVLIWVWRNPFMNQSFSDMGKDLGQQIGRTVEKVLGSRQVEDLGKIIHSTIENTTKTAVDAAKRSAENAQRRGSNRPSWEPSHTAYGSKVNRPYYKASNRPKAQQPPVYTPVRRKSPVDALGTVWVVLGFLGAIPMGLIFLGLLIACFVVPGSLMFFLTGLFLALCLACTVLIGYGFSRRRRAARFAQYQKVIHGKTYCSIGDLAAATHASPSFVVKDLKKMVRLRMFQEGYFDQKETCFILDFETYQQYLKTEENVRRQKMEEERKKERLYHNPEQAAVEDLLREGRQYIETIRQINLDLPEEDISKKLDTLEDVTSKIFDYVGQHPEKMPQIRKFMCYYLPTTMKLTEAYRDLEQNGLDTPEVQDTKSEIREALDKINQAFQNLLYNLVQDDLLDVSSNISALETMFAQEGLNSDQDFHPTL